MTTTFPYTSTITLSSGQARQAIALRREFPRLVRLAKGGDKGGLRIDLSDSMDTITIGATKNSFITVVTYKIESYYSANKPAPSFTKPKPPANANLYAGLDAEETHLVVFGKHRIPIPDKGAGPMTHRIQCGGGSIGSHTGISHAELSKGIQELVLYQGNPSTKTPKLGAAKANWTADHHWTSSTAAHRGSGNLLAPARPDHWFGLADMDDHNRVTLARNRKGKVDAKMKRRRSNKDATDANGTILDLQEHLAARDEEEAQSDRMTIDVVDGWGDDEPAVIEPATPVYEVPESWED